MRRRLLALTAVIALAAVLVLGIPLAIVEAHRERADAEAQLEREADAVAAAVDDRVESGRPIDVSALARRLPSAHQIRIRTRGGLVLIGGPIAGPRISARSGASSPVRVTASAPASEVAGRVRRRWLLIAALSAGGVIAAVLLGALQGRRLARPLEQLARTSAQLGEGDFSARAERSAIAEVDAVAAALDTTAIRIAHLLGRQRDFATNAAHQLRTPLTALRLRLEEIETLDDPQLAAHETARALAEVDRLQRTIADLLTMASDGRAGDARPLDLQMLARDHGARWRPLFARAGRRLDVRLEPQVSAVASAGAIGQAVDVLLENALHHGAGTVTLTVEDHDGRTVITVADEGTGIPAGAERRIFERGDSPAGGSGVGLHLARALIEADRGRLRLTRPRPARFEIVLPSAPQD